MIVPFCITFIAISCFINQLLKESSVKCSLSPLRTLQLNNDLEIEKNGATVEFSGKYFPEKEVSKRGYQEKSAMVKSALEKCTLENNAIEKKHVIMYSYMNKKIYWYNRYLKEG